MLLLFSPWISSQIQLFKMGFYPKQEQLYLWRLLADGSSSAVWRLRDANWVLKIVIQRWAASSDWRDARKSALLVKLATNIGMMRATKNDRNHLQEAFIWCGHQLFSLAHDPSANVGVGGAYGLYCSRPAGGDQEFQLKWRLLAFILKYHMMSRPGDGV